MNAPVDNYTPEHRAAQLAASRQLDALLDKYAENLIDNGDPEQYASTRCPTCRGRGSVPGDWVPYGSTSVQTPDLVCECVIEGARAQADELLESGGLELQEK